VGRLETVRTEGAKQYISFGTSTKKSSPAKVKKNRRKVGQPHARPCRQVKIELAVAANPITRKYKREK
jgi:hypothetical protein